MQSENNQKTGLARRMREWMQARTGTKAQRRFTIDQICAALDVPAGVAHQKVMNALYDFEARGEVVSGSANKRNQRYLLYTQDWRSALKGTLNRKIYKAMYVSGSFSVADLRRLTGLNERFYLDKIVKKLKEQGHIQVVSRRPCAHGAGAENVYYVANRDRFKLEVMR